MKIHAYTLDKNGKINMIVCGREFETPAYDLRLCNKCSLLCFDRRRCAIRDNKHECRPKDYFK